MASESVTEGLNAFSQLLSLFRGIVEYQWKDRKEQFITLLNIEQYIDAAHDDYIRISKRFEDDVRNVIAPKADAKEDIVESTKDSSKAFDAAKSKFVKEIDNRVLYSDFGKARADGILPNALDKYAKKVLFGALWYIQYYNSSVHVLSSEKDIEFYMNITKDQKYDYHWDTPRRALRYLVEKDTDPETLLSSILSERAEVSRRYNIFKASFGQLQMKWWMFPSDYEEKVG